MKKADVAKKMTGKCSVCGRSHNKSMHSSQKGRASLNPVQKSKDNMVMEGKNEQENN